MRRFLAALFALGTIAVPAVGLPAEAVVNARLDSMATSNTFSDASSEWDFVLRPSLGVGAEFADYWAVGYSGELAYFSQHTDLLSHWHEAYLFANPAWGEDGANELTVELRAQYLGNRRRYSAVDVFVPGLLASLVLEPASWLRLKVSAEAAYRLFYNDAPSSSFDAKGELSLTFSLPSRTTLTPSIAAGLRSYTTPIVLPSTGEPDPADFLLVVGLHASQALWPNAGLQLSGAYLPAVSNNALLLTKLSQEQFSYLGEDFLFSGWRARGVLKQVFGEVTLEASFLYEVRDFNGWSALGADGRLLDEQRRDTRLTPRASIRWAREVGERALREVALGLDYSYTRQLSNSALYDTEVHQAMLALSGAW